MSYEKYMGKDETGIQSKYDYNVPVGQSLSIYRSVNFGSKWEDDKQIGTVTGSGTFIDNNVTEPADYGYNPNGSGGPIDPAECPPTHEEKVRIFETLNDLDAQAAMALREGGDGVHEFYIKDTTLDTRERCIARGRAELELFKNPIVTINYATRDPKTRSGKTVVANLTNPPCVGTFKIQTVDIDQINISAGTGPRYHVTASNVRFTLEDLLRRALLR
jgi:hypothetical protein